MNEAEKLDHTPLQFGQYAGKTPSQIAEFDPAYIVWMSETFTVKKVSDLLARSCMEDPDS